MMRGNIVMKGYYKNPEATAEAFAGGYFHSGDVAFRHPDGYIKITDRAKDVIKSGGEWISSIDLENEVVGHPDVAEAAVIGIPHPKWDERPLLVVVAAEGKSPTADAILDHLRNKIAKWWMPDAVEFVDELPHTATGKISKKDLRKQFEGYKLPTA